MTCIVDGKLEGQGVLFLDLLMTCTFGMWLEVKPVAHCPTNDGEKRMSNDEDHGHLDSSQLFNCDVPLAIDGWNSR